MSHQARELRILAIALIVPVAVAFAALAVTFLLASAAHGPVAVHWDAGGAADGYGSAYTFPILIGALCLPLTVLFGGIAVVASHRGPITPAIKLFGVVGVWLSVGLGFSLTGLMIAQTSAHSTSIWPLPVGFGVATVVAVAAWFALPKLERPEPEADPESPVPSVPLSPTERAVWFRRASASRILLWGLVGLTAVLAAVGAWSAMATGGRGWWVGVIPLVVLLVALSNLAWTVRVDAQGVRVRSVVGLPTFRIPLAEIRSAAVTDVQPLSGYGGWGVRFGLNGRVGIILRAGEALEILRTKGHSLVVTVDDAISAAALVNALVEQRASGLS